jgi:hypothetical protein
MTIDVRSGEPVGDFHQGHGLAVVMARPFCFNIAGLAIFLSRRGAFFGSAFSVIGSRLASSICSKTAGTARVRGQSHSGVELGQRQGRNRQAWRASPFVSGIVGDFKRLSKMLSAR